MKIVALSFVLVFAASVAVFIALDYLIMSAQGLSLIFAG
jgi:hypothetical protein